MSSSDALDSRHVPDAFKISIQWAAPFPVVDIAVGRSCSFSTFSVCSAMALALAFQTRNAGLPSFPCKGEEILFFPSSPPCEGVLLWGEASGRGEEGESVFSRQFSRIELITVVVVPMEGNEGVEKLGMVGQGWSAWEEEDMEVKDVGEECRLDAVKRCDVMVVGGEGKSDDCVVSVVCSRRCNSCGGGSSMSSFSLVASTEVRERRWCVPMEKDGTEDEDRGVHCTASAVEEGLARSLVAGRWGSSIAFGSSEESMSVVVVVVVGRRRCGGSGSCGEEPNTKRSGAYTEDGEGAIVPSFPFPPFRLLFLVFFCGSSFRRREVIFSPSSPLCSPPFHGGGGRIRSRIGRDKEDRVGWE